MARKTTTKTTKAKKETPNKTTQPVSKTKEKSKKTLTFWPESTTREDKVSLFSFCLGLIVMTCFFIIDLQVRDYVYRHDSTTYLKSLARHIQNERQAQPNAPACNCEQKKHPKLHVKKPILKCPPTWKRQTVFNPKEYAPYDIQGNLTISGNVCSSLPEGSICPDKIDVFVNPKTSYSDEWWTKHWAGKYGISDVDQRALKYNKQGTVQAGGQFSITNLPAGTYYVGATACVSSAPNKPCRTIRWGTQVSLDKNTDISLKQVHPIQ